MKSVGLMRDLCISWADQGPRVMFPPPCAPPLPILAHIIPPAPDLQPRQVVRGPLPEAQLQVPPLVHHHLHQLPSRAGPAAHGGLDGGAGPAQ